MFLILQSLLFKNKISKKVFSVIFLENDISEVGDLLSPNELKNKEAVFKLLLLPNAIYEVKVNWLGNVKGAILTKSLYFLLSVR